MSILDPEWLENATDKKWLIAVSGGRDSIALIHACASITNLTESNSLVVCHVNHQLRGAESDEDEVLVRKLAAHYKLPISVHTAEVASIALEEKKSIELVAREVRHEAFSKACEEYQCDAVLLAHHADDQAETLLYNLLRGSAGLKGMQMETRLTEKKLTLVRPMLDVWRSQINEYISKNELSYREDLTNAEPFAVRNRLRNEAIPLLSEILERDIAPSLLRSLQHAEQNEQFIKEMIDYPGMLDPQGRIHLPSLTEVSQVIQQRILHRYLTEQRISNISHDLIDSCLSLLDSENPAKINLPGGKFLRRKERRIFVD
jgi:tRNA(Ile)-lysidine synthase